jgi:hypothetical protein
MTNGFLRQGVSVLSSLAEPFCTFDIVLRNALSLQAHQAEVVLGLDMPLLSRPAIPFCCLDNVRLDALTCH